MSMNFFIIIIGFSLLALTLFILSFLGWCHHQSITLEYREKYGYAKFSDFKKEFKNRQWKRKYGSSSALESENGDETTWVSESVLMFSGKNMIMKDPISWLRAVLLINSERAKIEKKQGW